MKVISKIFLCGICLIFYFDLGAQSLKPPLMFKVIYKELPKGNDPVRTAKLAVSVNRIINKEEFKEIVCRVTSEELHESFDILIMELFRDLEPGQYSPGALPDLEHGKEFSFPPRLQEARQLASYAWSRKLPEKSWFALDFDQNGNRTPDGERVFFDYKRDCPPGPK